MNYLDNNLDAQFVQTLENIQHNYGQLNKHFQIRVQKWVNKLFDYDENIRSKKTRNNYLRLLQYMVQKGRLQQPFNRMPSENNSLFLSDHELRTRIKMKTSKNKSMQLQHQQNNNYHPVKINPLLGDQIWINTPKQLTDRSLLSSSQVIHPQYRSTNQQLFKNLYILMKKYQSILHHHEQYEQFIEYLRRKTIIINTSLAQININDNSTYSMEVKVEEGIQQNKMNMFRINKNIQSNLNQIEYYKDTFHEY